MTNTQRFRFGLITPAGHRLPTKVEFSRRSEFSDGESESALVDTEIARVYRKLSFCCPHYTGAAADVQKVRALAGRPVTQARDVFDLAILFRGGYGPSAAWSQVLADGEHARAIDSLMGLTWQDYDGQVVEFLEAESRQEYGGKKVWNSLQNQVLNQLETDA